MPPQKYAVELNAASLWWGNVGKADLDEKVADSAGSVDPRAYWREVVIDPATEGELMGEFEKVNPNKFPGIKEFGAALFKYRTDGHATIVESWNNNPNRFYQFFAASVAVKLSMAYSAVLLAVDKNNGLVGQTREASSMDRSVQIAWVVNVIRPMITKISDALAQSNIPRSLEHDHKFKPAPLPKPKPKPKPTPKPTPPTEGKGTIFLWLLVILVLAGFSAWYKNSKRPRE